MIYVFGLEYGVCLVKLKNEVYPSASFLKSVWNQDRSLQISAQDFRSLPHAENRCFGLHVWLCHEEAFRHLKRLCACLRIEFFVQISSYVKKC